MADTTIIRPDGTTGADFVRLTDPIKQWLLDHEIRFVIRYFVPPHFTNIGKQYESSETSWYHDHGIGVLANFERSTGDDMGGAQRGHEYGVTAADVAADHDYPPELPIFVSVDRGIPPGELARAADYVRAFAEAIRPHPLGLYAPHNVAFAVGDLHPTYWRPNATSWWAGPGLVADIQQHLPVEHRTIDPNTAHSRIPVWLPRPDPTPQPPTPRRGLMRARFNTRPDDDDEAVKLARQYVLVPFDSEALDPASLGPLVVAELPFDVDQAERLGFDVEHRVT